MSELRDVRNKWANQEPFSSDDAYRALDSTGRLLTAVSAKEAQEVEKMKMELLRVRFDEQMRTEKRKTAGTAIETQATGQLTPWREVVSPHKDVASGRYQQAEFAADLWQVHIGEGTDEYKSPAEFLVLLDAVRGGFALITWERDGFAFGESFDEASGRYRGLRTLQQVAIGDASAPGLLVRPEVARKQLDAEKPPGPATSNAGGSSGSSAAIASHQADANVPSPLPAAKAVRRFHGNVALDPSRVGRDAGRIADEVISHLAGLVGSKVRVTLEIEAEFADGVGDHVVRTVTENSRTLRFTTHGFETD